MTPEMKTALVALLLALALTFRGVVLIIVLLLGAAAGVGWVISTYTFAVVTVVTLIATLVGIGVLFVRPKPRAVGNPRPEVDGLSLDAIPLGVFIRTREMYAPRLRECHWLVGGTTGFGKSNLLNALMVHLSRMPDVQVFVSDPKRGVEFGPWRARLASIARTRDQTLAMLRYLAAEVEARYDWLDAHGLRKVEEGMGFPFLVLIIDEANEILNLDPSDTRKNEALEIVESLISMGRAAGLSIVLCTQRPSAQSVPTNIRENADERIAFRSKTRETVKMILGGTDTSAIPFNLEFLPKGVAVVYDSHTETWQKVKFQLIPDQTVRDWAAETAHFNVPAVIRPLRPSPSTPTQRPRRRGRRPVRSS